MTSKKDHLQYSDISILKIISNFHSNSIPAEKCPFHSHYHSWVTILFHYHSISILWNWIISISIFFHFSFYFSLLCNKYYTPIIIDLLSPGTRQIIRFMQWIKRSSNYKASNVMFPLVWICTASIKMNSVWGKPLFPATDAFYFFAHWSRSHRGKICALHTLGTLELPLSPGPAHRFCCSEVASKLDGRCTGWLYIQAN